MRPVLTAGLIAALALSTAACAPRAAERAATGAPVAGNPSGMAAPEAQRLLTEHPEALVLDVRNPDEWDDDLGHIEGARLIPLPELPARMTKIEGWREKPVLVVCRVGVRSAEAAEILAGAGFQSVANLEGGMSAWRKAGL